MSFTNPGLRLREEASAPAGQHKPVVRVGALHRGFLGEERSKRSTKKPQNADKVNRKVHAARLIKQGCGLAEIPPGNKNKNLSLFMMGLLVGLVHVNKNKFSLAAARLIFSFVSVTQ